MKKLILFLTFLLISVFVYPQITFLKTYGGSGIELNECLNKSIGIINTTIDGGFVICHSTQSYGSPTYRGIYFLKLNQFGDTIFTKTFYSNDKDWFGRSVYQTSDGGYILGIGSQNDERAGLIKTDSSGSIIWTKIIGSDLGYYGLLLSGGSSLSTGGYLAANLSKFDLNGNLIFGKRYDPGSYPDQVLLHSSFECSNKDIISTGNYIHNGESQIVLLRTDSLGNIRFSKSYNVDSDNDEGYKVVELSDKSLIIVGQKMYGSNYNIAFLKTDSAGNLNFLKIIGDSIFQWSNSIIRDKHDNLYITGATTGGAFIIKLNSFGNIIWSKRYNSAEYGSGIAFTNDGGIVSAGMTSKFGAGSYDLYVLKTDSNGIAVGCDITEQSFPVINKSPTVAVLNLAVTNDTTVSSYSFLVAHGTSIYTVCEDSSSSIIESEQIKKIYIFPNPTRGILNIQIPNESKKTKTLEILDCIGHLQIIQTESFHEIDISKLASGFYFLVLTNTDNERQILKIIKE